MNPKDIHTVGILGGGESGVGAALLAKKLGQQPFVSEYAALSPTIRTELEMHGIAYEEGGHSMEKLAAMDLVVKSPGIPPEAPVLTQLHSLGRPVVGEIEYAWRYTTGRVIAITGTNGKTTTSQMCHAILQKAGYDVALAGNIHPSFARALAVGDHAWWVLEVSSFQLEDIDTFRPHIALLLNLSANHLNRHGDMHAYAAAKFRIAKNQTPEDYFILGLDSPGLMEALQEHPELLANAPGQRIGFSLAEPQLAALPPVLQLVGLAYYEAQSEHPSAESGAQKSTVNPHSLQPRPPATIHFSTMARTHKTKKRIPVQLKSDSTPNRYNALASAVVGSLVDIRKELVRESLQEFTNAPHRLEDAGSVNGIQFINDSKATNVNATWFALHSMTKPTVWIVGGVDKGNDYGMILDLVKEKVKHIVMLGRDVSKIEAAFAEHIENRYHATSMEEAVHKSYQFAEEGDAILLSPACASFDLFQDYEDRGNRFKRTIKNLR